MSADFETWVMRGVVAALGSCVAWFVAHGINAREAALKDFRREYTDEIKTISDRFAESLDQINGTMAGLSRAITDLQIMVSKEYATGDELKEMENRFERRLADCRGVGGPASVYTHERSL